MSGTSDAVVVDTKVVSSLVNSARDPDRSAAYRSVIAGRPVMVAFVTVTELRYGALKAGWGEFRRRGLERDLSRLTVVQPDDRLMTVCAELRAERERHGHSLGQKIHEADRWVAATALRMGLPLVSDDAIFVDVPDLVVLARHDRSP